MSSLSIRNLAPSRDLDHKAMAAVRGGAGFGNPDINVYVPISISQENNLVQNTSVLNGSVVGYGADLSGVKVNPTQIGFNGLQLPSSFV